MAKLLKVEAAFDCRRHEKGKHCRSRGLALIGFQGTAKCEDPDHFSFQAVPRTTRIAPLIAILIQNCGPEEQKNLKSLRPGGTYQRPATTVGDGVGTGWW